MSSNRLPSYEYQYRTSLYNNFNNQLLSGHNAGLALYDYDQDTKLYKDIDTKPLDRVNFDELNKKLDENYYKEEAYEKGKNMVKGFVQQVNDSTEQTGENIKKTIYDFIDHVAKAGKENIKQLMIIGFVFLVVYKKV